MIKFCFLLGSIIVFVNAIEPTTNQTMGTDKAARLKDASETAIKDKLVKMVKYDLNMKLDSIDHALVSLSDVYKSGYFYRFMKKYFTLLLKCPPRLLKQYVNVLSQDIATLESEIYDQESIRKITTRLKVASEKDAYKIKNVIVVYRLLLLEDKPARRGLINELNKMYVLSDLDDMKMYLQSLEKYQQYARVNISEITKNALKGLIFNKIRANTADITDKIIQAAIEYGFQTTFKPTNSHKRYRRFALRTKEHMFSDFLVDFFGTLGEYNAEQLMKALDTLDVELRNYNYEGCKFSEIFNYESRTYYNTFFSNLGMDPSRVAATLAIFKKGFQTRDTKFATALLGKFAYFLDGTYNSSHRNIFNDILDGMEAFKTKDVDLTILFQKGLKGILFDHVTNMTDEERQQFKAVMDTHSAKEEKELLEEEHKKHEEAKQQQPGLRQPPGGQQWYPQAIPGQKLRSFENKGKERFVNWEGNLDVILNFFK